MSLVVVGLSFRTAPVALLELASVGPDDLPGFVKAAVANPHVAEAVVVSTCNRVEVYADVRAFHAGVAELTALLAERAAVPVDELGPHLYVHFEDRAVQHLFQVVCGLDSMVVGEGQILGQVREAFRTAQAADTAGRRMVEVMQQALRVGKRAHSETAIDRTGSLLVTSGLDVAASVLGELPGRRALVVGAGSLSSLALSTLVRAGVTDVVVANRGAARGQALARTHGIRAVGLDALESELVDADLVVSCTGATGTVVSAAAVARAQAARGDRPLVLLDLAVPRDVDPAAADLGGVTVVGLEDLAGALAASGQAVQVEAVHSIVSAEVAAYLAAGQAARVAPTVVALRAMADTVVAVELERFDARRPGVDPVVRAELERTVRRVVDKLLHAPTVRVKELAAEPAGLAYAEALHTLFDLDPVRYREVAVADLHVVEIDAADPAPLPEDAS